MSDIQVTVIQPVVSVGLGQIPVSVTLPQGAQGIQGIPGLGWVFDARTLAAGTLAITVPATRMLFAVVVYPGVSTVLRIGTTLGGDEILSDIQSNPVTGASAMVQHCIFSAQPIYITSTAICFIKLIYIDL